jgi:selenocysteine lyase/cysteine desulfurase
MDFSRDPLSARLARWRADTPATAHRNHLNNAGAALMPEPVSRAIADHLRRETEIGGYEASEEAAKRLAGAYTALAGLLRARAENVAVVENATVAVAQALSAFPFAAGDRLVTTRVDYPSNQIMYMSLARRFGIEIVQADDTSEGGVDPESVRALASHPRCRLVSLTWVPTNSGLVQPAEAVGAVCRDVGVPYLVDACQSVGQMEIDVERLGCDYLAGTARKFLRGPRGIGFLYVSDRALERGDQPLYLDMRGADWTEPQGYRLVPSARRFENWEFAYALVLGMGEAARYAAEVGPIAFERGRDLAALLRRKLADLPGARLLDRGRELSALVTVAFAGRDAEEIKLALRERGINTSVSRKKDGLLDMEAKQATSALRLSPHYYNTEDEIDRAVETLRELLAAPPPSA